jgi:hypothetical protein
LPNSPRRALRVVAVLPDRTYRWLATLRETGIPLFAWAMALIFVAELVALIVYVAWLAGVAL